MAILNPNLHQFPLLGHHFLSRHQPSILTTLRLSSSILVLVIIRYRQSLARNSADSITKNVSRTNTSVSSTSSRFSSNTNNLSHSINALQSITIIHPGHSNSRDEGTIGGEKDVPELSKCQAERESIYHLQK